MENALLVIKSNCRHEKSAQLCWTGTQVFESLCFFEDVILKVRSLCLSENANAMFKNRKWGSL